MVGMIFVTGAGEYWVRVFDAYSATFGLSVVAFFEMVAVVYVYGFKQ